MNDAEMNRSYKLSLIMLDFISKQRDDIERDETLNWERLHMASCGRIAWCLALKRGVDPELAACAAEIHDIGRIVTGKQSGHAPAGEIPARELLTQCGMFSSDEIELLVAAAVNHSFKTVTGTPIEEIVKDADVIDCYQYGMPFDRPEKKERYDAFLARGY